MMDLEAKIITVGLIFSISVIVAHLIIRKINEK
jgi:hypothetical protein